MIDCQKAIEYIDLYIDQRLNNKEEERLFLHIDSCASCRKELDRAIALKKIFDDTEDLEPPLGLAVSAISRAKKRRFPVFIYASAGVAAAAVLIAVLAIGLGGGTHSSEMERTTNDMALSMPSEAAAGGAEEFAADTAESAVTMEEAAEDMDEGVADDSFEAVPQEKSDAIADDAQADMTSLSIPYYVPSDVAGPFWDALDSFLKENDIPMDYAYDGADNISFYIEEAYIDDLNALADEYGIEYGDLLPGMYITFIFNVE
jgi:hypothetical protein